MQTNKNTNYNDTVRQLKLPLEIEKLIDISDPVYTFCEVMDHIDLSKYFVGKGCKTGRPGCDKQKLLTALCGKLKNSAETISDISIFSMA